MKLFENKEIFKKIIIAFLTVFLLQYIVPVNFTFAEPIDDEFASETEDVENTEDSDWGGLLFTPIQNLLLALGDVGITALNHFIGGQAISIITLNLKGEAPDWIFGIGGAALIGGIAFLGGVPLITGIIGSAVAGGASWLERKFVKHVISEFTDDDFKTGIDLPIVTISPEEIFSNQIPLLDVNIINPKKYTYVDDNGEKKDVETTASVLQSTISAWYKVLKDMATVLFLSALVYIGIRIIISSVAADKAKYKKMLIDWLVGLCLLFTVHYIMSFAFTITDKFVELLSSTNEVITISSDKPNLNRYKQGDNSEVIKKYNIDDDGKPVSDKLSWRTNFIGYIRFFSQTNIKSMPLTLRFAYTLMYLILVIYTFMFLYQYIKRFMYIVFLTLMAPIMAVLYPIQKAGGKTPSTTKYIKDWGSNLSLILIHSILYKILMGTSIDLVTKNPIYGVLALASIMEAGKIFKNYVDAQGGSAAADDATNGLVTGALLMQGVKSVAGMAKGLGSGNSKKDSSRGSNANVRLANNRTSSHSSQQEDEFMDRALGSTSASGNTNSNGNSNSGNDTGNSGADTRNQGNNSNSDTDNNNLPDNSNTNIDNNNSPDGIDTIDNNYNNTDNQGQETDQMQQDSPLPGERSRYDNPNLENWSNDVDNNDSDNLLHQRDPEHYDEYGNYLPRDGKNVNNDNPNLQRWAKDVDKNKSDNLLHQRDPEHYDKYGNYLPHDGKNVNNDNPNLQRWAKDVDKNKSDNLLHQRDPEHHDKYGNYLPRDGKSQSNGTKKQIKSRPARVKDKAVAAKDKAKNAVGKVTNSKVGKEAAGRVRYYAPKVGKAVVKGTLAAAGAVTLGTIGLAAGAATQDNKDMITYGLGAGVAGISAGMGIGNTLVNNHNSMRERVQQRRNEIKREVYKNDPDGYEEYLNEQADKEFMRDKEVKRQYTEAFGASEAKKMMTYAKAYREHGITDDKIIIKSMKEKSGVIGRTESPIDDRRIAAAKLASGITNGKDIENMTKRLQSRGYEQNVIDQNEEFVRSIKGFKYN